MIGEREIRQLRKEAVTAGDWLQVAICDYALGEICDDQAVAIGIDCSASDYYPTLTHAEKRKLDSLDRDRAWDECDRVISEQVKPARSRRE